VVPSDAESEGWPEGSSEMKLGNIVQHIRSGNSYKDKREELDGMGFQFRVRAVKTNLPLPLPYRTFIDSP
jgi:hypothetical protein